MFCGLHINIAYFNVLCDLLHDSGLVDVIPEADVAQSGTNTPKTRQDHQVIMSADQSCYNENPYKSLNLTMLYNSVKIKK